VLLLQCAYGYSNKGLPPGLYLRHCTRCCYQPYTKDLYCAACRCASAYTRRTGKRCKGPWRFKLPRGCKRVTYLQGTNKLACLAPDTPKSGSSYGR
jgi:hypothetical protein